MTKKLITISVILTLAVTFGLVGVVQAAYNDITFTDETPVTVGSYELLISAGSKVAGMVVGASSITLTLEGDGTNDSSITFRSVTGRELTLDHAIVATRTCSGAGSTGFSTITVPYNAGHPLVSLTVGAVVCTPAALPVISSLVVTDSTTLTVTFSKEMRYITLKDSSTLVAVTTFAGVRPLSAAIDGRILTLTFTAGDLADAEVKDSSMLVLPTGQIEDTGLADFAGTDDQVVTTLSTINQLYDFVFAVQIGQNFMSVPYNVSTTLANSYTEGSAVISIQTIEDAGGNFAVASSAIPCVPLYGYYINSDTALYLRLKKKAAAQQSTGFARTFSGTGWHLIGVATNNVETAIASSTDDDVLSSLAGESGLVPAFYDRVVDIAVGITGDTNAGDQNATYSYTYDSTNNVYKALRDVDNIVTQTKAQIVAATGIEFNTGEAYFIWITIQNGVYIGEQVQTANLTL